MRIAVDGQDVYLENENSPTPADDQLNILKRLDFASLWNQAMAIDSSLEETLLEGVTMNIEAARQGGGISDGLDYQDSPRPAGSQNDLGRAISQAAAAASLFRMRGGRLPVMSSAGSGNHGITAIVPVALVARDLNCTGRNLAQAVALSHLVCGYLVSIHKRHLSSPGGVLARFQSSK